MCLKIKITKKNRSLFHFLLDHFEGRQLTKKQIKKHFKGKNTVFLTIHDVAMLLEMMFNERLAEIFEEDIRDVAFKPKPKYFDGILKNILNSK